MMRFVAFLALIFVPVFTKGNEDTSEKLIFCSYMTDRPNLIPFEIESLDPTLCTHIIYNSASIDEENHGIKPRFPYRDLDGDEGTGLYNRTMKLKEKNPGLKIILRICCFTDSFWEQVATSTDRDMTKSKFSKNIVNYLQSYGFDGVYIDIPENLNYLLFAIREEFDRHGYTLINFLPPKESPEEATITSAMAEPYHFLVTGSYWQMERNYTGIFSPLPELKRTISGYLDIGIPPEKLIVSIPAFGLSFKLLRANDTGIGAQICSPGNEGATPGTRMILLHYELMQKMSNASEGWVVARDNATGGMYGHSNSLLWTSYEDTVSVIAKAQYIIQKNLAGAAIMAVDMDDFMGFNEEGVKFPLTRAVHNALRGT